MGRSKDHRTFGFFLVDNRLITDHFDKLGPHCFSVYCAILCKMDQDRKTFPSYAWLTKKLRIGRRTVARSLATLASLQLLVVQHRAGKSSIYHVTELRTMTIRESENGSYVHLQTTEQNAIGINPCHSRTTTSSRQAPPQFPRGMPLGGDHVGVYQDPTTTTGDVVAVEGGSKVENPSGVALLTAQGVLLPKAKHLASHLSTPLLASIIAYWKKLRSKGKPLGAGMLVEICENPGEYGFEDQEGNLLKAPPEPADDLAARMSDTTRARLEDTKLRTLEARSAFLAAEQAALARNRAARSSKQRQPVSLDPS